ncbi:fatty acid desaturase family protein [Olivibacter domesticus]|uniref:Linoleoyl-CoA desaturase n=1 Tax=Olivibacter domesticus TaxID=407022 RepID=A0A1H7W940_OLID1|nr:acyl-CoA desaturase [Olivibacter domesticus]SEM17518.1 linoleoyl-CoA desaturase [Olivibacter domesticus]
MNSKLKFTNLHHSSFFSTVREKVDNYFQEKKISKQGNKAIWIKAFTFLFGHFLLYALIISGVFQPIILLPLAVLLGVFSAFIGFNIGHDAMHGSFSASPKINKVFSYTFHLVGANPYIWNISHNIVHHTYTNIAGHDEDIEVAPGLIRLSKEEKLNKFHRFQHLYAFPLYSLASLSWLFRKDYKKFFQPKIGQHKAKHPRIEYFNLFFYKLLYCFLFIGIPLLFTDLSWWQVLIGFFALHLSQGLVMGLVFQLAHLIEETDFPIPNEDGNIEDAWAEHQMKTTANFSSKSKLAAFLLGGLNRQIEHHLFPKISHIHYPAISTIIKDTANAYKLPYIENTTFLLALKSHYAVLKKFSVA